MSGTAQRDLTEDDGVELLLYLEDHLPEGGCDHTLHHTLAWGAETGLDPEHLTYEVERRGGYCDCEVLLNAVPRLLHF